MADVTATLINPSRVRYIKLGEGGRWEKECLDQGVIRIGFGSAHPERFQLCQSRDWDGLMESFSSGGKDKGALPASVWVEIEASAVEQDRDPEAPSVAKASGRVLDPLDL